MTVRLTPALYEALNRQFDQRLVFRLGASAGFFSEYNNMLYAMLYCLEHRIRFVLYSRDANFGKSDGWTDYFLPFTSEAKHGFHSRYNQRTMAEHSRSGVANRVKTKRFLQRLTGADFLTHDLFDAIREEAKSGRTYSVPELGIAGDIRTACQPLLEMTWRYKTEVALRLEATVSALNLPQHYIGFHIRMGDKGREAPLAGIHPYMEKAEARSDLRAAFVATDDFSTIRLLRTSYPEWEFFTLCPETSGGYDQGTFKVQSASFKEAALMELFASVEALAAADLFVGTFSSNVGNFLGLRMPPERCTGLDAERWYVW